MGRYSGDGYWASMSITAIAAAIHANDVMGTPQALTWKDKDGGKFRGGELKLVSSLFYVEDTALIASEAGYTLKLYSSLPANIPADNAAWDIPAGDRTAYQGSLAIGTPVDIGSTLVVEVDTYTKQISVASSGITYGVLQTLAGFTATATVRNIILHGVAL
jgi:hypothetical protein